MSAGHLTACPTGRQTGWLCGFVSSWLSCVRVAALPHACLGSPTAVPLRISPPLLHSRTMLPLARPVMPSCPPSRPCSSHRSVLAVHRYSPRLAYASRPSCRPSLTPRPPDTRDGERDETRTVAWLVRVYMTSCGVICLTFLLYISHSCYISSVFVIYLAFLLYVRHSCYMSRVLVISVRFMLYYFV